MFRPYAGCLRADAAARDRGFAGLRGRVVGYLPQDARAALDPLLRVGAQVSAVSRRFSGGDDPRPWLARAGATALDRLAGLYPHELSGGMAQRVVIAQALACGSRFLLADEPTTGLDATVQAELRAELRRVADSGIGILLVTHDLRELPGFADDVVCLDAGAVAERFRPEALRSGALTSPAARALLTATRRIAAGRLG